MLPFSLSVMLLMALASPVAAEDLTACSLLTSSEIEAATGGKVSGVEPMQLDDIETESNRVMKVLGCMWGLASHAGQLTITWFQGPLTDAEIAQLIKVSKNDIDDMKNENYKKISEDFPNAWCSTVTPPASDKSHLLLSTCAGGVKGQGLSMTFSSPTMSLTIDQAKTLFEKAGERAR